MDLRRDPGYKVERGTDHALAAADARNLARRQALQTRLDFDQFTAEIGYTINYAGWCDYCKDAKLTATCSRRRWWVWLDRFLKDQDAKDLRNTQADALT